MDDVLSFFVFKVEVGVEVGVRPAQVRPLGTRCWGISIWLV